MFERSGYGVFQYRESVRAAWLASKSGLNYIHPFDLGVNKNLALVSILFSLCFYMSICMSYKLIQLSLQSNHSWNVSAFCSDIRSKPAEMVLANCNKPFERWNWLPYFSLWFIIRWLPFVGLHHCSNVQCLSWSKHINSCHKLRKNSQMPIDYPSVCLMLTSIYYIWGQLQSLLAVCFRSLSWRTNYCPSNQIEVEQHGFFLFVSLLKYIKRYSIEIVSARKHIPGCCFFSFINHSVDERLKDCNFLTKVYTLWS